MTDDAGKRPVTEDDLNEMVVDLGQSILLLRMFVSLTMVELCNSRPNFRRTLEDILWQAENVEAGPRPEEGITALTLSQLERAQELLEFVSKMLPEPLEPRKLTLRE